VQVADPLAYPEEAKHEYGLDIIPIEKFKPACGVVFAVAHDQYRKRGWELPVSLLQNGKGVVADLKGVLPREQTPSGVSLWRL